MEAEPDDEPVILMLNLPSNAFCGIDLLSFTSSSKFNGFRTVPYGWHFLFTSASNDMSLRHGTWVNLTQIDSGRTVVIEQWDKAREQFVNVPSTSSHSLSDAQIKNLWREGLAPYTQNPAASEQKTAEDVGSGSEDWPRLTSFLTERILTRITRTSPSDDLSLTSASCYKEDREAIPGISEEDFEQPELFFTPIDLKASWRPGAVGRERTLAARDRSYLLGQIIEKYDTPKGAFELLGEFQFTFIMILTLNNYSCMEQWKRIFQMMLSCKEAIISRHTLFTEFLILLQLQLKHCSDVDEGLFDHSEEGGGLLREAIMGFKRDFEAIDERERPADVGEALNDLVEFVIEEFGWSMNDSYARRGYLDLEDGERVDMEVPDLEDEDERGEYAPVVVDLADTIPSNERVSA